MLVLLIGENVPLLFVLEPDENNEELSVGAGVDGMGGGDACVARSWLFIQIVCIYDSCALMTSGRRKRPHHPTTQPPPLRNRSDYLLRIHMMLVQPEHYRSVRRHSITPHLLALYPIERANASKSLRCSS